MNTTVLRILKLVAALVICYAAVTVVGTAAQVADAADRIHLGAGQPVFWSILSLLGALTLAPLWLYFRLPKPVNPPADKAEPAYSEYKAWLRTSLSRNPLLLNHPLQTEADLETALTMLGKEADALIRQTAGGVFVSTAVMQNGRLDGLIILAAQMRLVWKVASVYQLRPSPRQMLYLYSQVGATMLVASNIDDIDFSEITSPIVSAVAPSLATAVPGLQGIGSLLVNSLANGAANAFLTLRTGMIAKAYCCPLVSPSPVEVRKSASVAALAMLGGIARENGTRVASGIWNGVTGSAGAAARVAIGSIKTASGKVADATASAGGAVVDGVKVASGQVVAGTKVVVGGAIGAGKSVGRAVASATGSVTSNVQVAAGKVAGAAVSTASVVGGVARSATGQTRSNVQVPSTNGQPSITLKPSNAASEASVPSSLESPAGAGVAAGLALPNVTGQFADGGQTDLRPS